MYNKLPQRCFYFVCVSLVVMRTNLHDFLSTLCIRP